MARPKIKDRGQVKSILTISIEEKYLINQDKEKLREMAYNAITNNISLSHYNSLIDTVDELLKELAFHGFNNSTAIYNAKVVREATEI